MIIISPSFSRGEVNPELYGRVDTAAYRIGLATARNVVIRTTGGAINRAGLQFVGQQISMAAPSRLRRFRFNTSDTYMLEFGDQSMRVIRNDAHVLEAAKTIVSITPTNPPVLAVATHGWAQGNSIELSVNVPRLNARRFLVGPVPDVDHVVLYDIITGGPVDATTFGAFTAGTAARVYTLATPYLQADLKTLKFVQSADLMTITHPNYPEGKLTRTGDASWTLTNPTFAPGIGAPTGVSAAANTTGSTTASYVVTVTSNSTGEESLPSAPSTIANSADPLVNATLNTITWSASSGALSYSVYKAVNGVYGFIGTTPDLTFVDRNFAPSLAVTPPAAGNPFSGAGNYPACSTYYQQRHVRGGSLLRPDTMIYSRVANFYNFSTSAPSQASDAITASLVSREVNVIRHMVPAKDLLVFTAGGEWRINSSGTGFAANTMEQLSQSSWGCSNLEPIVVGLTTLFVPENQVSVRSFSYTYISDAYQGNDLTLMSGHLFQTYPMVDWGYSRTPDPVIYGVRADGQATAFTWQEEQQVSAWARWDTLGLFEAVDVIRPTTAQPDEIPYFGVFRVVNGHVVRYIERMHSRRFTDVRDCFFVDCGLTFDQPVPITDVTPTNPALITCPGHGFSTGQLVDISGITWASVFDDEDNETQPAQLNNQRYPLTVVDVNHFTVPVDATHFNTLVSSGNARIPVLNVGGLDHLEGRTVQALADGNVVSDLVVLNGAVTLPFPASRVHVGLKYISDIETLDLESSQGTIQGKLKRAPNVTIRFDKSRGLFLGESAARLEEIKQRQDENMGDPTALFSGDIIKILGSSWNEQGRIFLRQRYPLPMNILDIIPNLAIEGG